MSKQFNKPNYFLPPGISPGEPPPYHRMDAILFQGLCRDLLDKEPGITTCEIYGKSGQAQYGVDLLAHRAINEGVEVGQCKCYKSFPPVEIRKASEEFFKYWGHWSDKFVKRFILFVACDMSDRNQQDEIISQKKCFADKGIAYEAWSATGITNKIRSYPGIVSTYLGPPDYWVSYICGAAPVAPLSGETSRPQVSATAFAVLDNQLTQLAKLVSGETEQRLEEMRTKWREGRKGDVKTWLNDLKNNDGLWTVLPPEVKSKLLRFEASLELAMTGDVSFAKKLADQAHCITPAENDSKLRALIAYKEFGAEPALKILAGQEDIDALNLKAGLLLESGELEECRLTLESATNGYEPNPETLRIRALLNLLTHDVGLAQLDITKATELAPTWQSIRFVHAIIDYYSSLSLSALPSLLPPWPEPIDWALVKRDDVSIKRLRDAEENFRKLAEGIEQDEEDQERLGAWRLACLANDPERREVAANYCRDLLQSDPTRYPAIPWSIARNFGIDLGPSERALKELVDSGNAKIPHIVALVNCYLVLQKARIAIKLLADTKDIFDKNQGNVLWVLWHVQSLVVDNDPETALQIIEGSEFKDKLRHVRVMALETLGKKTGDWAPLANYLETCYRETHDSSFLLKCCELKAWQKDWAYVAERAKLLIDKIDTAHTVRLVAIALHNCEQYRFCMAILDANVDLFLHRKLPSELRRIRVHCQQLLGLPAALSDAELLVQEEPSAENLLALAALYFDRGDLRNLAIVARKIYTQSGLAAEQLLGISHWLQLEDRELAISFWKKAKEQGIPDNLLGTAVTLGYQLGLDKDMGPLMTRMGKLGQLGQAGIQIATIEELVSFAKEHQNHMEKLEEAYRTGIAPIHIIAEQARMPLVKLYHGFLEERELQPDPRIQPHLLARHGGRGLIPGSLTSDIDLHLYLDITAVLLGAHLNILDPVEANFKPLYIPIDLIPSLIEMRENISPHQPSVLKAYQQIIDLEQQGLLQALESTVPVDYKNGLIIEELGDDWVASFEEVRLKDGYLVDFLPLKKRDLSGPPTALPADANRYIINCRSIVEALRQQGPLSGQEYSTALDALGSEGKTILAEIPEQHKVLYFHFSVPEVLAGADLLRIICNHFQVRVEKRYLDRVRISLREFAKDQQIVGWLNGLIERIRRGIDTGIYIVIPSSAPTKEEKQSESNDPASLRCLLSLLKFEAKPGDLIWVDDRYVNGYIRKDHGSIIGINEVLQLLLDIGAIDNDCYYDKLSRLRSANIRFIPLQKAEILFYLRQARIENGKIIETRALNIIRRYLAACLLQSKILQRPPLPGNTANKHGEIAFIVGITKCIIDTLIEIWDTEEDIRSAQAFSDWIIDNLYIDHSGLVSAASLSKNEKEDNYLVSVSLSGLISQAISLKRGRKGEHSPRRDYLSWLNDKVLAKRFESGPSLLVATADLLKKVLVDVRNDVPQNEQTPVITLLLQLFYQDLPDSLRNEIGRDDDFMSSIGINKQLSVTIEDLRFDPKEFVRIVREVLDGHEAIASPIGSSVQVKFQPNKGQSSHAAFVLIHPQTGKTITIVDDTLELLTESPGRREAVLKKNRQWLDLPAKEHANVISEIVSSEDPWYRFETVKSWQRSSASVYYSRLYEKLSKESQFQFNDLMPPKASSLIRHLRLPSSADSAISFHDALSDAARILVSEEGLQSSIERLAGLPVILPDVIMEAISKFSAEEKRNFIKRLLREPGSPVSLLHLLFILRHLSNGASIYLRLTRRIIGKLLDQQITVDIEAFISLLKWVNNEFGKQQDYRKLTPHVRLALVWAHTHRLFSIFTATGAPTDFLKETFDQQRITGEMFERNPDYWFDIAHPHFIYRATFLLKGLCYGIGEDAASLIDDRRRKILTEQAFQEMNTTRMPMPPLLLNFQLAYNHLESYLGLEQAEIYVLLFGRDEASRLSVDSLTELTEKLLEELIRTKGESSTWAYLYAVISGLPLPEKYAKDIERVIRETNYATLFDKDITSGKLAMQTACLQIFNLKNEELRTYLKNQLATITKLVAAKKLEIASGDSSENSARELSLLLAEWALNISLAARESQNVISDFVEMLTQMLDIWPPMGSVIKPVIQSLYEELPITQSQSFLTLYLRLRAD